jgi:hypothetical protein
VVGRGGDGSNYYSGTLSSTGAWSAWSVVSHLAAPATAPSWNTHVTCKAVVTTLETVVGNQLSPLGGATFDSGHFNPSIPDADRTADSPACSVDGQGMLVEVHGVMMVNGCSAAADGDWSCNVYDPAATSVPYNLRVVHTEAVSAWASHPGWNPTHPPSGQLIDVQGFVWWDPTHTDADWHTYSGWEFHPFTAWRPAQ